MLNNLYKIQMQNNQTEISSYFNHHHALAIRIWHWVTFSLFTATIIMVLLAKTMFDTHGNIGMVQDQVKEKGGIVTQDQARNVAHEYNDKLWNTHKIIGYILCFALLSRVVIEVAVSKEERILSRIKQATGISKLSVNKINDSKHYIMVKYLYLLFYLLFFIMACTGLILAFEDTEFLKPIHNAAKSLHEFVQYLIYGYIVIHLVGVILADVTSNPGIVSRMINNGKS